MTSSGAEGPPGSSSSGRLFKNTAAQYVTPAVRLSLGLAQAAVLARYLGVSGLGQYAAVLAFVAAVNGVVNDIGLGTIVLREIARRPAERSVLVPTAAALQLVISVVSYVLLLAAALALHYPPLVVVSIAVFGLSLPLIAVDLLACPFQADLEQARLIAPGIVGSILNFVFVIAVTIARGPLPLLVGATLAALLVQYAWLARMSLAKLGPQLTVQASEWRPLLRESIPIGLTTVVTSLTQQAPVLFLSLLTFDGAGLYNAASRIPQQLLLIPLSLRASTFPTLSREWNADKHRFKSILDRLLAVQSLAVVPLLVLGISLSGDVMSLLFGPAFRGAGPAFALLMAAFALISVGLLFGEALNAAGFQRLNLATVAATAPVMVVLLLGLAPGAGATGAAAAYFGYCLALASGAVLVAGRRLAAGAAVRHIPIGLAAVLLGLTVAAIPALPAGAGASLGALASLGVLLIWNKRLIKDVLKMYPSPLARRL